MRTFPIRDNVGNVFAFEIPAQFLGWLDVCVILPVFLTFVLEDGGLALPRSTSGFGTMTASTSSTSPTGTTAGGGSDRMTRMRCTSHSTTSNGRSRVPRGRVGPDDQLLN
jgi:hypothetical protein